MKLEIKDLIENEIYVVRANDSTFDWIISYKKLYNKKGSQGFSVFIHKRSYVDNYHNTGPDFNEKVWENIRKPTKIELEYYYAYKKHLKCHGEKLQYKDFLENLKHKIYELW